MTRPRKELVSVQDTPYYHVVSRCVRRTFLCGLDRQTNRDYEHRRQWIVNRIRLLSSLFAVEICAYAVMSNHYHIVVKLQPDQTEQWNVAEVIERWTSLYKGPLLVQRQRSGENLAPVELETLNDIVAVWRKRLGDLSWFMKCLNEPIAREANKEDQCTGHFWESRYKSQALFTEEALLSCMAYVDLNPVRAGVAETPESSDYTSLKERIEPQFDVNEAIREQSTWGIFNHFNLCIKPLLQFSGNTTCEDQQGIPFTLIDYLELVDWTGKAIRRDKPGFIANHLPPILERQSVPTTDWLANSQAFEQVYTGRKRRQHRDRRAGTIANHLPQV